MLRDLLAGPLLGLFPVRQKHGRTRNAGRAQQGVGVTSELLAVDLVRQIGPGGTFLGLPDTASGMFTEHLVRGLWDRRLRDEWEAAGAPSPQQAAQAKVEQILNEPTDPLPDAVEAAIMDVVGNLAKRDNAPQLVDLLERS